MLTIAGFDPSSGAGITADLQVFAAHGLFGTSCVTALTIQTTTGVRGLHAVPTGVLTASLNLLAEDLPPSAVKLGMLANSENVEVVAAFLERLRERGLRVPVVLDPVMRATSGAELLSKAGEAAMRHRLLPLVDWVTPNRSELGALTGRAVHTATDMEEAAHLLVADFAASGLNVVATGGDFEGADDFVASADGSAAWMRGTRLSSRATHGTGCAFSSALACGLCIGLDGAQAALRAKQFVFEAIARAAPIGEGFGPMNLLWPLTHS